MRVRWGWGYIFKEKLLILQVEMEPVRVGRGWRVILIEKMLNFISILQVEMKTGEGGRGVNFRKKIAQ